MTGVGDITDVHLASVKHLPPTLVAQYHFLEPNATFRPFIGAGLNYTVFFDEEASSTLKAVLNTDDVKVELDSSFGIALQAGFNYHLNEKWGIHAMVSKMDINTDASFYSDIT